MERRTNSSWLIIYHNLHLISVIFKIVVTMYYHYVFAGSQGSDGFNVYPRNKVLEVGRIATFCCIVPDGESFVDMYLSGNHGTNMSTTKISNQTYALTVHLNHASDKCVDLKCKTNRTQGDYGACNFILCKYKLVFEILVL